MPHATTLAGDALFAEDASEGSIMAINALFPVPIALQERQRTPADMSREEREDQWRRALRQQLAPSNVDTSDDLPEVPLEYALARQLNVDQGRLRDNADLMIAYGGSPSMRPTTRERVPERMAALVHALAREAMENEPAIVRAAELRLSVISCSREHEAVCQLLDRASMSSALPEPPEEFFCPLSRSAMRDPVCAADGQLYDRAWILEFLQREAKIGNVPVSPVCRTKLTSCGQPLPLHPCKPMLTLMERWVKTSRTQGADF